MHESGDFSWNFTFTLIHWHLLDDKDVQIKLYHDWVSAWSIFLFCVSDLTEDKANEHEEDHKAP